jgi:hypothetical protein
MKDKGEKVPHLAAYVGNDGASLTYVGSESLRKSRFWSTLVKMPSTTTEIELLKRLWMKMMKSMVLLYVATSEQWWAKKY